VKNIDYFVKEITELGKKSVDGILKYGLTMVDAKNTLAESDYKKFLERTHYTEKSASVRKWICIGNAYVRDGDSLVITKLDRLARSTRDLLNIMQRMEDKQVKLVVLDQQIDTSTPTGMLLFTMLGAIATFENDLRKDRQMQGIELAKRKGTKFGRRFLLTTEQVDELRQKRLEGVKIVDLMQEFKLSKASVYRVLSSHC
jgi:hypothetical protein